MNAVEEDRTSRRFPESKHRSARVRKKLIKRYGSEFDWKPVIMKIPGNLVAHPAFKAALEGRR